MWYCKGKSAIETTCFVLHCVYKEANWTELLFSFVSFEPSRDGVDGV